MTEKSKIEYTVYFAGALFDHKELIGNALLASYIDDLSKGKYKCVLPQDLEQTTDRAVVIRNQDLAQVMKCDLAIFNFDGSELDSGTVVEFLYAKSLDIPSVIIRSDFRGSGEQGEEGDKWNLMASFYPRTRKLEFNSKDWYQSKISSPKNVQHLFDMADPLYKKMAKAVINELDAVKENPPIISIDRDQGFNIYNWALLFPGNGLDEVGLDIRNIIVSKKNKGLIA